MLKRFKVLFYIARAILLLSTISLHGRLRQVNCIEAELINFDQEKEKRQSVAAKQGKTCVA